MFNICTVTITHCTLPINYILYGKRDSNPYYPEPKSGASASSAIPADFETYSISFYFLLKTHILYSIRESNPCFLLERQTSLPLDE
jgi:hypothetical protein